MESPTITIPQGTLQGRIAEDYKGGKYYSFQAIPYAKPPLGPLRFKAPQPPEPWQGIKDCTKEGSECFSKDFLQRDKIVGSEDCLHLSVYTSKLPHGKPNLKPVMFWIHGGGFTMGSNKVDLYGPDYLVTEDVVLVAINYRLGVLGFLSFEDPSIGVPGNNAFKDMVMALKWVQKNIQHFNGDPNNVTIFGESAGGAATHLLVLSPMAKGLFHRAIIQSGCALNPWPHGTRCAKYLAEQMGFKSDNEKEIFDMLKNAKPMDILEGQFKTYDGLEADKIRHHGVVVEHPSSEPAFLTEHPIDILRAGKQNKVPLMIGYNSKEGMLTEVWYKGEGKTVEQILIKDFETKVPHHYLLPKGSDLSLKIADKIKQFYFGGKEHSVDMMDKFYDLETDRFFSREIQLAAKFHRKSAPEMPIYFYRFDVDRELNFFKMIGGIKSKGASHCDDLGYLFKTIFVPPLTHGSIEDFLVQRMVRLWANFARTGNPNPTSTDPLIDATWVPVSPHKMNYLAITDGLKMDHDPDLKRMQFWDEVAGMVKDEMEKDIEIKILLD